MSDLDFSTFFTAVHGHPPFPWQTRLAAQVVESGSWPALLNLPTGVGKTSALDVAVYSLAVRPEVAPRRVFMVVDRRIIVAQATRHAKKLLAALMTKPELRPVADRLRGLFGGAPSSAPFEVAELRGGMPRETEWAKRPDRPVLALSTVDQVGSRLLFRGYGVSERLAPVHAGLVGNDALYLLDEVHLAIPFKETLEQIRTRWRSHSSAVPERFQVVQMSATPGTEAAQPFELDHMDRANGVIAKRIGAKKPVELEAVKVAGTEPRRRQMLGLAAAKKARAFVDAGARSVCVVLNRVDAARHAWRELEGRTELEVHLLTGRMRPLDRDRLLEEGGSLMRRLEAGSREPSDRPLVVVATQSIEAGADFDFDALVSECASYDALKQRFGRLDRRGERPEVRAAVLIRSDQEKDSSADPIYHSALSETWALLAKHAEGLDLGISGAPVADDLERVLAPRQCAPIILPAHLDAWCQTSPVPEPSPEVALYLHGPEPQRPEVQVVWRADIEEGDLDWSEERVSGSRTREETQERLTERLAACRPSPAEALSIPIYALRAWLEGDAEPEVADTVTDAITSEAQRAEGKRVIRWTSEGAVVVASAEVRPGDTLVVPAVRGGLSASNWDPDSEDLVEDLGDLAQWRHRRRPTLRLHLAALPPDLRQVEGLPSGKAEEDSPLIERVEQWLERASERAETKEWWAEVVQALDKPRVVVLKDGDVVVFGKADRDEGAPSTDDEAGPSAGAPETTLTEHSQDVRRWASDFVEHLGLPTVIAEDVRLAAFFHDLGKADPRFQRWLCGGSEIRYALLDAPLAKSTIPSRDRASVRIARVRAGYPQGERHELLSVELLERTAGALDEAHDPDLVLHLVGSHHGYCRPFAPARDWPEDIPVEVELEGRRFGASTRHRKAALDSGVPDRFWRLVERYGWWGLAYLETLVRLADHRASEEKQ